MDTQEEKVAEKGAEVPGKSNHSFPESKQYKAGHPAKRFHFHNNLITICRFTTK